MTIIKEENPLYEGLGSFLLRGTDALFALRFLRLLTTPWEKTNAYRKGIIDAKGNVILSGNNVPSSDRKYYTIFHRLVFNIKKLIDKIPVIGKSIITKYAAALFLLKEQTGIDDKSLCELLEIEDDFFKNHCLNEEHISLLDKNAPFFLEKETGTILECLGTIEGDGLFSSMEFIKVRAINEGDSDNHFYISLYDTDDFQSIKESAVTVGAVGNVSIPPLHRNSAERKYKIIDTEDQDTYSMLTRNTGKRKKYSRWTNTVSISNNENLRKQIYKSFKNGELPFVRNKCTGDIICLQQISKTNTKNSYLKKHESTMASQNKFAKIKDLLKESEEILSNAAIQEDESDLTTYSQFMDEVHEEVVLEFMNLKSDDINADTFDQYFESMVHKIVENKIQHTPISLFTVNEIVENYFSEYEDDLVSEGITGEFFGINKLKDMFLDYKTAITKLDQIVKDEIKKSKDGKTLPKTLEFYAQKLDHQIKGKFDPKKLAKMYRAEYMKAESTITDDHSLIEHIARTAADEGHQLTEEISDKEFDEILSKVMASRLGDDLIDSIESGDVKGAEKIVDVDVDDMKKTKQIVKRIMGS